VHTEYDSGSGRASASPIRRRLLGNVAVVVPALAAGWAVGAGDGPPDTASPDAGAAAPVAAVGARPDGKRQAGVDRPA